MSRRLPTVSSSEVMFVRQQCKGGTISLRHQLAQEGCTESQLTIARSLLDETGLCSCEERKNNSNLAVHWLLLAAEKGSGEAIELLKSCSDTGIGINGSNCFAVAKCLRLSEEEVSARRIGHSIFAVMSDSEDALPEGTFQEKVDEMLCGDDTEPKTSDAVFKSKNEDEDEISTTSTNEPCISVRDVIASVQQCLEGNLPSVTLTHITQFADGNKWFSLMKYIRKLSEMFRSALITFVQDTGSTDFPLTFILCLILAFFLNSFNVSGLGNVVTDQILVLTVLSLVIIISCSCFCVRLHVGLVNINRWLDLITLFEPTVKSQEIREKYMGQNLMSFIWFYIASILFNVLFPANLLKSLVEDLFLFSMVMVVLLDRTVTDQRRHVNISLLLNMILCLYKHNLLVNVGWLQYLSFDLCLPLWGGYEIHVTWLSCLTLLVLPYFYVKMMLSCDRRGWHLVLFPHLMCLTWLNWSANFYSSCEMNYLYSSFTFWLVTLFLVRYFGSLVALSVTCIAKSLYLTGTWSSYSVWLQVFALIMCIVVCKLLARKLKSMFRGFTLVLMLCAAFAFTLFFNLSATGNTSVSQPILPWYKYESYCHRHAWYHSNPAEVEIACLPLKGKRIDIEGTVNSIGITTVSNRLNFFVSILPSPISEWVTCALGDSFCHEEKMSAVEKERCSLYDSMNVNHCHLQNWNTYEYRILIEVHSRTSPEIILKADHKCSAFVKTLREGDSLHFVGILDKPVGSERPELLLEDATCSTCSENVKCKTGTLYSSTQLDFSLSIRHIVQFYLSPIIQPIS